MTMASIFVPLRLLKFGLALNVAAGCAGPSGVAAAATSDAAPDSAGSVAACAVDESRQRDSRDSRCARGLNMARHFRRRTRECDNKAVLKLLESEVPVLDLHRRTRVNLDAELALGGAILRVVVDEDRHDLTVEDVHQRVAARDDVHLVPILFADRFRELLVVADAADHLALAAVDRARDLPAQGHERAAALFVVVARVPHLRGVLPAAAVDVELIAVHREFRIIQRRAAVVDTAVAQRRDAIRELQLEVADDPAAQLSTAPATDPAAPDDERVPLDLVARRDLTHEGAVLDTPECFIPLPPLRPICRRRFARTRLRDRK